MRTTFDIAALRMIVAGAELGSFARAADRLGRSQSAVSMQLKRLEEQTGKALFRRSGRGLVPTEAGDALLAYARRIIALNDEAAASLGAIPAAAVRLGLPQDFAEDVLPEVILRFARKWPLVQVEAHVGRSFALGQEVDSGRLDVAIAFASHGTPGPGSTLVSLPLIWLGGKKPIAEGAIPLALFDHPCLFRQNALQALEAHGPEWRIALTTPSLPGLWAALRSGLGITARTAHRVPAGLGDVRKKFGMPALPRIDLRLFAGNTLSPAAADLRDTLRTVVQAQGRARG
ncbi:MAG: LysR family transcriptional regulator [Dongia sp.]